MIRDKWKYYAIAILCVFSGCTNIQTSTNRNDFCKESVFSYQNYNTNPITDYEIYESPFQIENGQIVRIDSVFRDANSDLATLLMNQNLIPANNSGELLSYSLKTMNNFKYTGEDGSTHTGICCLDVVSLYVFYWRNKSKFVLLYCLPFDQNYRPSENAYDFVMILMKVNADNNVEILISTKQASSDLISIGGISPSGDLGFIFDTNEYENKNIRYYEFEPKNNAFVRTKKYLRIDYDNVGRQIVNCSQSNWF